MDGPAGRQVMDYLEKRLPHLLTPRSPREWLRRTRSIRKDMLNLFFEGHPPNLLSAPFKVRRAGVIDDFKEYRIRKLCYEGYPGLWNGALLYEPKRLSSGMPAALNPSGHFPGGNAMIHKQARCINLVKRGFLALSYEFPGTGELASITDHNDLKLLDLCGLAGVGVFYLVMKRALDLLLGQPRIDRRRVLMTGLSGGGWQTAILSALDPRVTHIVPVAGHSAVWQRRCFRCDIGDSEQVPRDFCTVADYDTLSAMFAPRPSLFIYNRADDCCFRPERTRVSVFFPARRVYDLLDARDKTDFYVNRDPGTHNYDSDNRSRLYRFINTHMGLNAPENDLPWQDDLLTENQAAVGLPPDNATLITLARRELVSIRKRRALCPRPNAAKQRRELSRILRLPRYGVPMAKHEGSFSGKGGTVEEWRLRVGNEWDIPVTVVLPRKPEDIRLVMKARLTIEQIRRERLPIGGRHVTVYADVLGQGELDCSWQYHLLIEATGARSLGIMVAQLLAIIAWLRKTLPGLPATLATNQEMGWTAALIAAALRPGRIARICPSGRLRRSLDCLIEAGTPHTNDTAPLFCFGLLKAFDLPDLIALTGRTRIAAANRGPLKTIQ